MTVWVMRSSRSCLLPCHPTGRGLAEGAPDSTMGTASPWPGPNQRGLCPTGDQALDRKQADTVREVNQALPEVQKSHLQTQTPCVLSSQGWAFFPNVNNRLSLFKNEIQNKAHQYPAIQKAQRGFQFCFPQPSTVPLCKVTCSSHLGRKIPRTQVSPRQWHCAPALQTGLSTRHSADLFLVVHKFTRKKPHK